MTMFAVRSFVIILLLAQPAFAGEVNGTLSSRLDFYPDRDDGTASEGRSAEVKIDAFHDFDASRIVGEFIARGDEKDSGRRITEARQAYLRTPLAGLMFLLEIVRNFGARQKAKMLLTLLTSRMPPQMRVNQVNLGHHLYRLSAI